MNDESLSKHTLNLFAGDFNRLQELHPELGASVIIRHIVHKYIRELTPVEPKIKGLDVKI